jgi:hypothetical protein
MRGIMYGAVVCLSVVLGQGIEAKAGELGAPIPADSDSDYSTLPQPGEITIREPSPEQFQTCMREAISINGVTKEDGGINNYRCYGDTAEDWFNFMSDKPTREVRGSNGLWRTRSFGRGGYCAQQIQNSDGTAAESFSCTITQQGP